MKTVLIKKIKIFEAEIDASMSKKEILKIFSKIENTKLDSRRQSGSYKTVRIQRGKHPNEQTYNIEFINDVLERVDYSTSQNMYASPRLAEILEIALIPELNQGLDEIIDSDMINFVTILQWLEGKNKVPVEEKLLIHELVKMEIPQEKVKIILTSARRQQICYESKPGHYNLNDFEVETKEIKN